MKKILLLTPSKTSTAREKAELFASNVAECLGPNFSVEFSGISDLFFELSQNKIAIYDVNKKFDLRDFDLVVMRHIGGMAAEAHAIAAYCDFFNIRYTDEYLNRLLPDNKMSTQFALWVGGIKNWPHSFYGELNEMKRRFIEFGDQAILKDNEGSKGRLNFLVRSPEEIQKIHDDNPGINFILQEFIPNEGDLRILVFGGEPAMAISRKSNTKSHLNNTSQGGSAKILPLDSVSKDILEISKKAAEIIKLQVAGVDVMVDSRSDKIYLLEVNNAPQVSSGSFVDVKTKKYADFLSRECDHYKKDTIFSAFETVKFLEVVNQRPLDDIEVIAKIDTGAFSGVVHAEKIFEKDGILSFDLFGNEKLHFETQDFRFRNVRNTHGGVKKRFLVKFGILIEGKRFEALFGLDNRSKMKFEMLIGRAFLIKNNVLVDSCRKINLDEEWEQMGEKQ